MPPEAAQPRRWRHFTWRRHDDPRCWEGQRNEVLATDGTRIRAFTNFADKLVLQEWSDHNFAQKLVAFIDHNTARGMPLMGYTLFEHAPRLAILFTGNDLGNGWIASPIHESRSIPTLPMSSAVEPSVLLRCNAIRRGSQHDPALRATLASRDASASSSTHTIALVPQIEGWTLLARRRTPDATTSLRLVRPNTEPSQLVHDDCLEKTWPLDPVLVREFGADPHLELFAQVVLSPQLLPLPEELRTFTFRLQIADLT